MRSFFRHFVGIKITKISIMTFFALFGRDFDRKHLNMRVIIIRSVKKIKKLTKKNQKNRM